MEMFAEFPLWSRNFVCIIFNTRGQGPMGLSYRSTSIGSSSSSSSGSNFVIKIEENM